MLSTAKAKPSAPVHAQLPHAVLSSTFAVHAQVSSWGDRRRRQKAGANDRKTRRGIGTNKPVFPEMPRLTTRTSTSVSQD
jgi:hypothetical protein